MVWLFATGLCKVKVFSNILQQLYYSDKETLVMVQDFSSATWYPENLTPSLRDRRPGCVTQIMEKKWSQSLANFCVYVWWEEENLLVSCHSEEWAVVVMMLKYEKMGRCSELSHWGRWQCASEKYIFIMWPLWGRFKRARCWCVILHIPESFPLIRPTYHLFDAWRQRST